nr:DUF2997 domain-containing protein [Anaerolineae bacterium]
MSGKQKIEFVIKPDGTVEESVSGVTGPSCETLTEALERALGTIEQREHLPEYFNQQHTEDQLPNQTAG